MDISAAAVKELREQGLEGKALKDAGDAAVVAQRQGRLIQDPEQKIPERVACLFDFIK